MLGQRIEERGIKPNGVIAMSKDPLAIFTISVSGFQPIYLPVANIYGIQECFELRRFRQLLKW